MAVVHTRASSEDPGAGSRGVSAVDLSRIPEPNNGEVPTRYADRVGEWYVEGMSGKHRKEYGLYLTPISVAHFMSSGLDARNEPLRLLDPAAGSGILICAAIESIRFQTHRPKEIHVVAYELDRQLVPALQTVLGYLSTWCQEVLDIKLKVTVHAQDFVLKHARTLKLFGTLFPYDSDEQRFDLIISNPPYFKIPKGDPRARAADSVVHGQPNIYALFMAVSAAILNPQGILVFIVPRSFASGPYFCKFRSVFFQMIKPKQVHVFGSRRETFSRDQVLQENVIFFGSKDEHWHQNSDDSELLVTYSSGAGDLANASQHRVPTSNSLELGSLQKVMRLPLNADDDATLAVIDSWPYRLGTFGLNISTGPVVPFRAKNLIHNEGNVANTHVPLLWMNHVKALKVQWPLNRHKREFICRTGSDTLLVANRNYVLVRRFSAKEEFRRLTAAPYIACHYDVPRVGFENHLNYIHRPGSELDEDEAWGLATLYNSRLFNDYFRIVNGNTQVSATELRTFPLPSMKVIRSIGRSMRGLPDPLAKVDEVASEHIPSFQSSKSDCG